MATLWTFPGAPAGNPLDNPVTTPHPATDPSSSPGRGSRSIRDARADDARNADTENHLQFSDARPQVLTDEPGQPPALKPAGVPSRRARMPRLAGLNWRMLVDWNPHADVGAHGELVAGAADNPGAQNPGVSQHRNTYRQAPAPWDTAFFVSPQEG